MECLERSCQQVDKASQESQKYQAKEHDRDNQPDGRDGRPARGIATLTEGSYARDSSPYNDEQDHQDHRQEYLQPELTAMVLVRGVFPGELRFHIVILT